METNKIDEIFKDAFLNKTIQPSKNSWNVLQEKLIAQEKANKKKSWVLILSAAASIALFLAINFYPITEEIKINKEIVDSEKTEISKPIHLQNELKTPSTLIVEKEDKPVLQKEKKSNNFIGAKIKTTKNISELDTLSLYMASLPVLEKKSEKATVNRITVQPETLLEALSEERKTTEITTKPTLVDPESLLAAVESPQPQEENTITEKIVKTIKTNFTSIATAIADRNK